MFVLHLWEPPPSALFYTCPTKQLPKTSPEFRASSVLKKSVIENEYYSCCRAKFILKERGLK